MDKKEKSFQGYLAEIESLEYDDTDTSWGLPENPTPLEQAKYDICEKILGYQQDNNLSDKEIAQKIHLTTGETKDILYCHIDYFTLDRLITYASRLFSQQEIRVTIEPKKDNLNARAV